MKQDFPLTDNVEKRIAAVQAVYNRFRENCIEKGYDDPHAAAYDLTVLYFENVRKGQAMVEVRHD